MYQILNGMEVREVYFMHVSNFKWNGSNFQVREVYFMHVSNFKHSFKGLDVKSFLSTNFCLL